MKEIQKVHIAINCADESVCLMEFVTDDGKTIKQKPTNKNIQAVIEQSSIAWAPSKLPITGWRIIQENEIPKDRAFRNAWKDDGGITVDMEKARELHRQNMRIERAPVLAALDIEYQRADESRSRVEKDVIAEKKQALRDVTDDHAIDAAQTPEELKQVWPDVLRG